MKVNGIEVNMSSLYSKYGTEKVKIIREVRELTGAGLKEAKGAVDLYFDSISVGKSEDEIFVPAEISEKGYAELSKEERQKQKEAESGLLVKLDGANGIVELYANRIVIRRKGFRGVLGHGFFKGDKEIILKSITGVQVKKAGLVVLGYIQFSMMGGNEGRRGLTEATQDENTVTFDSSQNKIAEEVKNKVFELQQQAESKSVSQIINPLSGADEILKYKQLLDEGIITQEEFNAKKKQLLGL